MKRWSRRALLQSLGAGVAASPFVPLLNASGQEPVVPQRLVLIYTPHGTIYDAWKPQGSSSDFTLSPILQPLAAHQSKLVILDGLEITHSNVSAPSHTEGFSLLWTASNLGQGSQFNFQGDLFDWVTGPSVDQTIAQQIGGATAFPSVELAVRPGGGNAPNTRMIYSGPAQPVQPEGDPHEAFDRIFAGVTPNTGPDPAVERAKAEKQSVIDAVKSQLTRLEPKVAQADRLKIEAHLEGVRALERRLQMGYSPAACAPPELGGGSDDMAAIWDQQWDVLSGALACDLTRVASLQLRYGDNDGDSYPWLGVNGSHHEMSHAGDGDAGARDQLTKIYTWYAERIAAFLDKLAAIPEGDGTLLDHTLVVWGSEVGKGNNHSFDRIPFVLAGGCGGKLVMGRYLTYDGVPHNRLLVSLCQLLGLDGVTTFGTTDQGSGPLAGLV
jgi:hypothetical protein